MKEQLRSSTKAAGPHRALNKAGTPYAAICVEKNNGCPVSGPARGQGMTDEGTRNEASSRPPVNCR